MYSSYGGSRRISQVTPMVAHTSLVLLFFYLAGFGWWSYLFIDVWQWGKELCTTPASEIMCGNGQSYVDRIQSLGLNRINDKGEMFGCGCGQGIIRDWACASNEVMFSISYYISTPTATGMLACLTVWPIHCMWKSGGQNLDRMIRNSSIPEKDYGWWHWALVIGVAGFSIFYGLFLFCTLCFLPFVHGAVVALFNLCAMIYYVTVARILNKWSHGATRPYETRLKARFCVAICIFGAVMISLGFNADAIFPFEKGSWWQQHTFYITEVCGLYSGLSLGPLLLWFDLDESQKDRRKADQRMREQQLPWL